METSCSICKTTGLDFEPSERGSGQTPCDSLEIKGAEFGGGDGGKIWLRFWEDSANRLYGLLQQSPSVDPLAEFHAGLDIVRAERGYPPRDTTLDLGCPAAEEAAAALYGTDWREEMEA